MWNVFEQPWTGLVAAVVLWNVLAVVRWFVPLKWKAMWLPPLAVALAAVGLWYFVQTDREKINTIVDTVVSSVRNNEPAAIDRVMHADYRDQQHRSKAEFMNSISRWLTNYKIDAAAVTDRKIEIDRRRAEVILAGSIRAEAAQFGIVVVPGKVKVTLEKTGKQWLIISAELLEVAGSSSSWRNF